jgi:hypothetical protein
MPAVAWLVKNKFHAFLMESGCSLPVPKSAIGPYHMSHPPNFWKNHFNIIITPMPACSK